MSTASEPPARKEGEEAVRDRIRLGVLISGTGRTLQNLIDRIRDGRLEAEISVVISSRDGVPGIERAREAGLPTSVLRRREYRDDEEYGEAIARELDVRGARLAVMAGFLHLFRFPERWKGRVLNIHPALLPKYGGKGFYGRRVHEAVLAAGERESGCTVHWADLEYDHGPVLLQKKVPVLPGDTPESLAERVFAAECEAYPEAIERIGRGAARWD